MITYKEKLREYTQQELIRKYYKFYNNLNKSQSHSELYSNKPVTWPKKIEGFHLVEEKGIS